MFDEFKEGLAAPLAESDLFLVLAVWPRRSLILGFLELQSGQAHARFHNELEDWLASGPRVVRRKGGTARPAVARELKNAIDRLRPGWRKAATAAASPRR